MKPLPDATHIYPENDLAQHTLSGTEVCPCGPRIMLGGHLVVHNSWDRRELRERAEELMRRDKTTRWEG